MGHEVMNKGERKIGDDPVHRRFPVFMTHDFMTSWRIQCIRHSDADPPSVTQKPRVWTYKSPRRIRDGARRASVLSFVHFAAAGDALAVDRPPLRPGGRLLGYLRSLTDMNSPVQEARRALAPPRDPLGGVGAGAGILLPFRLEPLAFGALPRRNRLRAGLVPRERTITSSWPLHLGSWLARSFRAGVRARRSSPA